MSNRNLNNSVDDFEATTGMPYSAALELAVEARTERRLFGPGRSSERRQPAPVPMAFDDAAFTRATGWTWKDAFEMAIEARSDSANGFDRRYLN
jgi:hypothetical protein